MNLNDLKTLNLKNIGNWPIPIQLTIFLIIIIIIMIISYFLDWSEQFESIHKAEQEEISLKDVFLEKKRLAVNLDAYEKQQKEIEDSFSALLRQLPNKSQMENLLVSITEAGRGRNLVFQDFRPASQETMKEYYAELPIFIRIRGYYHDFGAFVSDLSKQPRIVLLKNINIHSDKSDALIMDATAITYRYLNSEEVVHQKKGKQGKHGKK